MRVPSAPAAFVLAGALAVLAGCDSPAVVTSPALPPDPSFARFALAPDLPPAEDFVYPITDPNPYFPLIPKTVWEYVAQTEDGLERTGDTVLEETKTINAGTGSITATVVLDEVYVCEEAETVEDCAGNWMLVEETYDWYAQDEAGNVWYLGEDSREFDEETGEWETTGSWEAGVDGAEAGIIMWADPFAHKGKTYRQEYYEGEAEDMAKVLHRGQTVTVPAGTFTDCIETMDFTPLEPGAREHKFYCSGVGMVLEVQPKGGRIRNELVRFEIP